MAQDAVLLPGATLGVLGGGQLGRMFVHAAQSLGYRTVVLDPDADSPAGLVAHEHIRADYLDEAALNRLAQACDAITTEFENVPARVYRSCDPSFTTKKPAPKIVRSRLRSVATSEPTFVLMSIDFTPTPSPTCVGFLPPIVADGAAACDVVIDNKSPNVTRLPR